MHTITIDGLTQPLDSLIVQYAYANACTLHMTYELLNFDGEPLKLALLRPCVYVVDH